MNFGATGRFLVRFHSVKTSLRAKPGRAMRADDRHSAKEIQLSTRRVMDCFRLRAERFGGLVPAKLAQKA